MDDLGERVAVVETKLEQIHQDVKIILERLVGNGQPGYVVRLDRLEKDAERRKWGLRALAVATLGLAGKWLVS